MQRCRIRFSLSGEVKFNVQVGEEATADELIQSLADGCPPAWLEHLVMESLAISEIELDDVSITGDEPMLGEELDFDE
jgi:hypothetical protein